MLLLRSPDVLVKMFDFVVKMFDFVLQCWILVHAGALQSGAICKGWL